MSVARTVKEYKVTSYNNKAHKLSKADNYYLFFKIK